MILHHIKPHYFLFIYIPELGGGEWWEMDKKVIKVIMISGDVNQSEQRILYLITI